VLVVVNLRPQEPRVGRLELDRDALRLGDGATLAARDLLDGAEHVWPTDAITIECTPDAPVRVFRVS
jgi:hypothetical protein